MADEQPVVTGGVDTHKWTHVAAVVDPVGRLRGTASFPASTAGYRQLLGWMRSFGDLDRVGVEGTGAYGAGLARFFRAERVVVVEVDRPDRQDRRRRGKSDPVDAEAAARAVMSGRATVIPKAADGIVESIRVLRVAFCSARDARTRVANQIRDLVLTAPAGLRERLEPLATPDRVETCARFRCGDDLVDPYDAVRYALKNLARRYAALTGDLDQLRSQLDELTTMANPSLRAAHGVGVDVASILLVAAGDNPERLHSQAAFAALCGVSPIEASSGQHVRHRLNQGGNRDANHALWRIATVRLSSDERTQAYAAHRKKTKTNSTPRDTIRCLKRFIAREIYQHLVNPQPVPGTDDLRPRRQAAGLTLADAANHFDVWPAAISQIELGQRRNDQLANRYRTWLNHLEHL